MKKTKVDSKLYDQRYFLESGGSQEYFKGLLPRWTKISLSLVEINSKKSVLDIGCGRGEVISFCARLGAMTVGMDYSTAAIEFSNSQRRSFLVEGKSFSLIKADVLDLPFLEESFDIVFMLDIVEHLYPEELVLALLNAKRILKSGGNLIIHTVPNANYYRFGYPVYRAVWNLFGKKLPKDPRERVYHGEVHVNEQTPVSLKQTLLYCGFKSVRTWLKQLSGSFVKRAFCNLPGINYFFANDIIALTEK